MTIFLPDVAGFLATDPYFHPSFKTSINQEICPNKHANNHSRTNEK